MSLKEIRFHGRGGDGVVTASELLAIAAFHDKKFGQGFPMFGVERRGAPVQAFTRLNENPINIRSQIYQPDYVIVLDPSLLNVLDCTAGLKENGLLIVNTDKKASQLNLKIKARIECIDATKIALEAIGKPIVNAAILGAFASITKEISVNALEQALKERFASNPAMAEKNIKAIHGVFKVCESCKVKI